MYTVASTFPRRNGRFGRPYMMLNADSRAENSETELQRSAPAPTTDSVVAFSCTAFTTSTIDSTDRAGKTSSR
jgi:hypothetical protein